MAEFGREARLVHVGQLEVEEGGGGVAGGRGLPFGQITGAVIQPEIMRHTAVARQKEPPTAVATAHVQNCQRPCGQHAQQAIKARHRFAPALVKRFSELLVEGAVQGDELLGDVGVHGGRGAEEQGSRGAGEQGGIFIPQSAFPIPHSPHRICSPYAHNAGIPPVCQKRMVCWRVKAPQRMRSMRPPIARPV